MLFKDNCLICHKKIPKWRKKFCSSVCNKAMISKRKQSHTVNFVDNNLKWAIEKYWYYFHKNQIPNKNSPDFALYSYGKYLIHEKTNN